MNTKKIQIDYLIVVISSVLIFCTRFIYSGNDVYSFYSDDFFYYLKIAENIVLNDFSSFNGIVGTNGYHPLWQFILAGLYKLFSSDYILYVIAIIQIISAVISYYLLKKILSKYCDDAYSIFASISIFLSIILISKSGMEVIITIPSFLYSLYLIIYEQKKILKLSFVISIMVLSRLDSAILAMIMYLSLFFNKRITFRDMGIVLLGSIPVIIYLVGNLIVYEHLMPVSGAAKQLKSSFSPVLNSLLSAFNLYPGRVIYSLIPMLMLFFALCHFLFAKQKLVKEVRYLLFFPVIVLLYYSFESGWGLWSWYFYILIPSSIYFFLAYYKVLKKYATYLKYLALGFTILWISTNVIIKKPDGNIDYKRKMALVEFFEGKEGRIAMGDAAGLPGYLLDNPVIQLEGLVMDFEYLEILKAQDLDSIFSFYDIDYYVTITAKQSEDGTWTFTEPWHHHPNIINCTKKTNEQPIFQTGDSWLDIRVWEIKK